MGRAAILLLFLLLATSAGALNETVLSFVDSARAPISNAKVKIYKDNVLVSEVKTNETGQVVLTLQSGEYIFEIGKFLSKQSVREDLLAGGLVTIRASRGMGATQFRAGLGFEIFRAYPAWLKVSIIVAIAALLTISFFAIRFGYKGMRSRKHRAIVSFLLFFVYYIILIATLPSKISVQPKPEVSEEKKEEELEQKKYDKLFKKERY